MIMMVTGCVSLTRAVYYDADVALLDDILSAVDSHVSKYIVDQCLLRGPMADKTHVREYFYHSFIFAPGLY